MTVDRVRFGEIASLLRRAVSIEPATEYVEVGLRSFAKGVFLKEPITGADLGNKRVFHVHPGDLLVSNIFAWEGAVAVADDRHSGAVGSHRFMTWKTIDRVNAQYLVHYFASDPGLAQLRAASPGSAGRNRTLSISALERIEVPLPPLAEQRRIAEHLDSIKRSTSVDRRAAMETHWRAVIEQVAGAPEVAARIELHQILSARGGVTTSHDEEYRIAGVYSFGRGLLERSSIRGHETKYTTLTQLRTGDVVYSKLGAFEGAVAVVSPDFDGAYVSPEFPVFTVSDKFEPTYLRYCFIAVSFVEQLNGATSGVGARQKRVAPRRFLELTVPWRPLDDQRRLARQLDDMTRAVALAGRADELAAAVLPAARNEIFNSMS